VSHWLDDAARGLSDGRFSRRQVLRRGGAVAVGTLAASVTGPMGALTSAASAGLRAGGQHKCRDGHGHTCQTGQTCCGIKHCCDSRSEQCCGGECISKALVCCKPGAVVAEGVGAFGCKRHDVCCDTESHAECYDPSSHQCCRSHGQVRICKHYTEQCCEKACCDKKAGEKCCDGTTCCNKGKGETCCNGKCCDSAHMCCGGECCDLGDCFGTTCCNPVGNSAHDGKRSVGCGGQCCAPGALCCSGTCCAAGDTCVNGLCTPGRCAPYCGQPGASTAPCGSTNDARGCCPTGQCCVNVFGPIGQILTHQCCPESIGGQPVTYSCGSMCCPSPPYTTCSGQVGGNVCQ